MMFQRLDITQRPRRPWLAVVLGISVLGHLCLFTSLVVAAAWDIDKLAKPSRPVVLASPLLLPTPTLDEPKPQERTIKTPKQTPGSTRQPTSQFANRAKPQDATGEAPMLISPHGTADSSGTATGSGPPGLGDGALVAPALPDVIVTIGAPPPPPPPSKPQVVHAQVLEGRRITGDALIQPPSDVQMAMYREGKRQVRGSVRMCLDTSGSVTSLDIQQSTGYETYDRELIARMRAWRYQPYQTDGKAIPVCAAVTFVYNMVD